MDQFMKAFKLNLSKVEKLNFNANFSYLVYYIDNIKPCIAMGEFLNPPNCHR